MVKHFPTVDQLMQEIESLRSRNRELITQGARVLEEAHKATVENETLRSDKEHLLTVCELRRLETEELKSDYENVCQDIKLQNKQMGEWYADKRQVEDERDEWKRRAEILWACVARPGDIPIKAADWFEEE